MTPKDLAQAIFDEVVEEPLTEFFNNLEDSSRASRGAPIDVELHKFWAELSDSQKEVVRKLVRNTAIDTASHVLGIIDGPTLLEKYRGEFCLTYDGGPPLNGDLQDLFLAKAYGWGQRLRARARGFNVK